MQKGGDPVARAAARYDDIGIGTDGHELLGAGRDSRAEGFRPGDLDQAGCQRRRFLAATEVEKSDNSNEKDRRYLRK